MRLAAVDIDVRRREPDDLSASRAFAVSDNRHDKLQIVLNKLAGYWLGREEPHLDQPLVPAEGEKHAAYS